MRFYCPEPGQFLTVHSQVNGGVYMLTAFASFLADSQGEEQDDGFLGFKNSKMLSPSSSLHLAM